MIVDFVAIYKDLRAQFDTVLIELNEAEKTVQQALIVRDGIKERALGLQRVTTELGNFIEVQQAIQLDTAPVILAMPSPTIAL